MNVRSHATGSPNWFELGTRDAAAAEAFYTALFGWTREHSPMPDGSRYTLFRLDDRVVAACYPLGAEAAAMPSNWGVYFRVEDCDYAAGEVRALGGSVVVEPFDVDPHARVAVCADPGGAVFSLYQPYDHPGVEAVRERNAVCWVELATRDIERDEAFYTRLFEWSMHSHDASPVPYRLFGNADGTLGGLMQMTPEWGEIPAHWSLYVQVEDVDAAVARAQTLGGTVCVPAFDAPGVGRIARIDDPAGAGFYLIALAQAC
ncbi:VOC family protein [Vulcaniibacterium thermophilum]|jgi:uncharacterized protein|uniref:Glyoxalase n=1 Tax=Vulcaniibacterium thermophilum TaxID=1169913 RepID=A0A919DA34_9GAMM|nr:VOC family protein [Vulcaniibacterium thermophilum]GHE31228.1 glyoxalase [Vulcaniibacterium thermophilum]